MEKCRIQVEDAPYIAVEMWAEGTGVNQQLEFRTNVDDKLIAGPENPIRVEVDPGSGEPSPYVLVREGLEALIARAVYYDRGGGARRRDPVRRLERRGFLSAW